jgi:hypothetical protein
MNQTKSIYSQLKPFLNHWLIQPWRLYLTIFFIVVALVFGSKGADQARWAGLALQLLGLSGVAVGLWDTLNLFNRPSVWGTIFNHVRNSPPLLTKSTPIRRANWDTAHLHESVSRSITRELGPEATVEERITALEHN